MNLLKKLTCKITIEEPKLLFDQVGGYKRSWHIKCQCWAQIESLFNRKLVGSEVAVAKKIVSSNFCQFTIRYRNDLNQNMRLIYEDRQFTIIKIITEYYPRRYIRILAEENLESSTM